MQESNFSHLPLPFVLSGIPKLTGGGAQDRRTKENRQNRIQHGSYIKSRTSELSRFWRERKETTDTPKIQCGIPVLLEIDPNTDIEFLRGLGFEIVSELEEGFIIVATDDVDFTKLNEKVDKFIIHYNSRSDSPARIYGLMTEDDRIERILSDDLFEKWGSIKDDETWVVDIGVECSGSIALPKYPKRDIDETDAHYDGRITRWKENFSYNYMLWDELKSEREEKLEKYLAHYNGEICSGYIDGDAMFSELPDSFSARLRVTGKCLRDLVNNFGYIFEVTLPDDIHRTHTTSEISIIDDNLTITAPNEDDPIVCVIDSGIQEEHKYIEPAIRKDESICLLRETTDISDRAPNGGHGTRVTGVVLYPNDIPVSGQYQLPCWIRNLRVLDENNFLPPDISPSNIIKTAVRGFYTDAEKKTKIYNHSIGSNAPCRIKHMSSWAAEIDNQSYENDVLFIQAAGNLRMNIIKSYIQAGYDYPLYLTKPLCRICNPAQSLQAVTVGSISLSTYHTDDADSLGDRDHPSSFTRSGPGIWDTVKPDVVEYGGTDVLNKDRNVLTLTTPPEVCPELIRVSPEGPAYSRDSVGTSFSTPKVSYIASQLQKILPDAPSLLYRALIVQSAKWPQWTLGSDPADVIRVLGYGIPDANRATTNDEYRVTLITEDEKIIGTREAHIYQVPIPEELREIGEDIEILIEITLSYTAKPRRTRRFIKRYLSTWLEWESSNIGEDLETFERRILTEGHRIQDEGDFHWVIGPALNRGDADDFSRRNSTVQKDWTIIKSHKLRDSFCIAVRGHEGWGAAFKAKYSLVVSFEAIYQDIAIYEPIRQAVEVEIEAQEIEQEIEIPVTVINQPQ